MSEEKNSDPKKSASNSLLLTIMGVIVALIIVQTFLETKVAAISFSYQLEHLVNLDLIQPTESRKTAAGQNLVHFSGKFRDNLTEEGKKRYKYLALLDKVHELELTKTQEETDLVKLQQQAVDAAKYYLQLYGKEIPASGYSVVDEMYDTPERENHILIQTEIKKQPSSLRNIQLEFEQVNQTDIPEVNTLFSNFQMLVRNLRSPQLGIGDERIKNSLRAVDDTLESATKVNKRYQVVGEELPQITDIMEDLGKEEDHIRLRKLRSVRNYKKAVDAYKDTSTQFFEAKAQLDKAEQDVSQTIWYFNNKELSTRALERQDPETYHQWFIAATAEWKSFPANSGGYFRAPDQPVNKVLEKTFKSEEPPPNYISYLISFAPVLLILFLLYLAFSKQVKGMGGGAMDFGKSPARLYPKGETKVTFKDVAGIDEALEELQEIVEFLKNPEKFTALGGRIPKGILCIGPPGTGKTLIAKAVAGEADCPFFSISGSDFVEMFVGVGASRIRKMFEEAKKNAPCIIFIDEIDAVGRHRGAGIGGGHDEREQTLNQLLVEMDGFDSTQSVIIIAATNRPDVLDKALLRPGRFDRQVHIPFPDIRGRFEILNVHAKKIKLDDSVDLMAVARSTPGCSGADLMNLLNEAALLAARNNRIAVTTNELTAARDKVLYGKERRNLEIDEQERKRTAYHESGHAVVGLVVEHADPIDKVTIIPRGLSLGATQFLPEKNRVSYWRTELLDHLAVLMGGHVAEEIFVKDLSSGVRQDIEQATRLARSMVCEWGMSNTLGTVAYTDQSESGQYGMSSHKDKSYSEKTAQEIDIEVKRILKEAKDKAYDILITHSAAVELMTEMLIKYETLDAEDVKKIIAGTFTEEEKQQRLEEMARRHKKLEEKVTPPPPPPRMAQEPNGLQPN